MDTKYAKIKEVISINFFITVTNIGCRIKVIVYLSIFVSLTAGGAFIKIPFPYVPVTLQSVFVIISGNMLGPRYGALSQVIYLIIGLVGVPIFAQGGGIGYIFQPTFGYLLAYPIGAYVSGKFSSPLLMESESLPKSKDYGRNNFMSLLIVNTFSMLIIFFIGVLYLYLNINFILGKEISFYSAISTGFIIFIPSDMLKLIGATLLTMKLKKYIYQLSELR